MSKPIQRTPTLVFAALVALVLFSTAHGTNYVLKILGSSVGEHAPVFEQETSIARYAADKVGWTSDTLTVEPMGYDDSPVLVATRIVDGSAEADVIGMIGPGDEFDSLASVVAARVGLPMVSYPIEGTPYNTTTFPYVSLHPGPQMIVQAMLELYLHYGWTRIAVLYTPEFAENIIGLGYVYQPYGIELVPIPIVEVGHSYYHIFEQLVSQNLNVMVVVATDVQVSLRILSGAEEAQVMRGRAWIVYAQHEDLPEIPFQGVITFQETEGLSSKLAEFTTLIQSLDPSTYPGTGSGVEVDHHGALVYDAVNVYAAAIVNLQAASLPITRPNLMQAIRSLSLDGVIGRIVFDSTGARLFGTINFVVTNVNGVQETFMTWNGTLDERFAPVWPGNSLAIPVTTTVSLPIAVLVPFDLGISEDYRPITRKVFEYAVNRMNTVPDLLPPGYLMVPYLFDHGESGMLAVQYASNASRLGIVAAVGSTVSRMSVYMQTVFGGAGIPQLSPGSTEPDLSVKELFPTFMRMSSTSTEEAAAIIDLLKAFRWRSISVINLESDVALDFYQMALDAEINLVNSLIVEADYEDEEDAEEAIENIRNLNPRILVILAGPESIGTVSRYILGAGIKPLAVVTSSAFTFHNSSIYTSNLSLPEDFYDGWITTGQTSGHGATFDFLTEELANLTGQPGFDGVADLVRQSALLQRSFDCVYSIADSIRRTVEKGEDPRDGRELLESLYETDLDGVTGRIQFDEEGDRLPDIEIRNIKGGRMGTVARWSETEGLTWSGTVTWPGGGTEVPLDRQPRTPTWLKWDSSGGIALSVLAGIGLLLGLLVLGVIFVQRGSPVIMSATWELLIVMILGAMLGFGSVFVWIGYPRVWICALRIWLPAMASILIIAPLIAKTWRLHKIFSLKDLKTTPIPLSRLIMMVVVLVLLQVVICIFWISLGTISVGTVDAQDDLNLVYVTCSSNDSSRIAAYVTYGYLGLLIVFCCYLAFRVRKLPKDFNESRWIAVSIYNILIFSVLVMLLGYTLKKFIVTVAVLICVGTLAICFVAIGAMMGPKIWELVIHPERRSSSSGSGSSSKMKATTTGGSHANRSVRNYSKSSTGTGGRRTNTGNSSNASSGSHSHHISPSSSKNGSPLTEFKPHGKSDMSDAPLRPRTSLSSSSSPSSSSSE